MTTKDAEEPVGIDLPKSLKATRLGAVAHLRLARPEKRNALDDVIVLGIETFFHRLPEDCAGGGAYGRRRAFLRRPRPRRSCRGRDIAAGIAIRACGIARSRRSSSAARRSSPRCTARWSAAGSSLRRRPISASPSARPITGCRRGSAASSSAAAARCRIARLIGVARVQDMMLTGRTLNAEEGHRRASRSIWSRTARGSRRRWSLPPRRPPIR